MRLPTLLCGLLLAGATSAATPTLHLAGDSTMGPKLEEKRPETGWGERLEEVLAPGAARIVNHARNGRSTRRFVEEGRWQALLESLSPGDLVLIQFGHNDQSRDKPDRYTPPDDFKAYLARFSAEVRARQARPVLLTPVVRRRFDAEGAFYDSHGEYPDLVRAVAAEHDVPLLDLTRTTEILLRAHGEADSRHLFLWLAPGEHPNYPDGIEDNTHFSPEGALAVARLVAEALGRLDARFTPVEGRVGMP